MECEEDNALRDDLCQAHIGTHVSSSAARPLLLCLGILPSLTLLLPCIPTEPAKGEDTPF